MAKGKNQHVVKHPVDTKWIPGTLDTGDTGDIILITWASCWFWS